MKLTLRVIDLPGGAAIVLPDKARAAAQIEQLKRSGDVAAIEAATSLERAHAEMESRAGDLVRLATFDVRPYTYGEKLAARARHTKIENDQARLDIEPYQMDLAAVCCGIAPDDIAQMPPNVAQALIAVAFEVSEPSVNALDYFPLAGAPDGA